MTALLTHAAPAPAGDRLLERRWASAEAVVCAAVLFGLGLRIYLPSHVPLGLLPVLASAPVWLRALPRFRWARALMVLAVLAVVVGLGLSLYSTGNHAVQRLELASELGLALLTLLGIGVVLWGRQCLGTQTTAVLVAAGMLVGGVLHPASSNLNLWKGGLATPVIALVLALTYRRAGATVIALLALAGVSAAFDTRAQGIVLVLCALLVAWQLRPAASARRSSVVRTAVILGLLGLLAYYLGTQALVRGYFGPTAQERSIEQIDAAGSLILGGRPEIAATLALMLSHPQGYGFGVLPRSTDVLAAKEGMVAINYDPNNGYVERFMFGGGFELHSMVGDLWVRTGPVGLVLLAALAVVLVRGLADRLPHRTANGLVLFLSLWTFWNLLFSPLLNGGLALTLVVGLVLTRAPTPGHPVEEPAALASRREGSDR